MAFIRINNSYATIGLSAPLKRSGAFAADATYETEYIQDLWKRYPIDQRVSSTLYEGMQVYIAKGSEWLHDWSNEIGPPTYPDGVNYIRSEEKKKDIIYTTHHKGEIWVLTDLDNAKNELYTFNIATMSEQPTQNKFGWTKLGGDANLQWEQLK